MGIIKTGIRHAKRSVRRAVLGEVDYEKHVRVAVPISKTEDEIIWVKITKGDKNKGHGIVDHEPRECGLRLGTVIRFQRQRPKDEYARYVGRAVGQPNRTSELLADLAAELQSAMTWRPGN